MKVNKLLKVASVAVLASTLAACGNDKVSEKEYKEWAEKNGYVLESGIDYEGWAEDNGYEKEKVAKPNLEVTFNNYKDVAATEADEQTRNLTEIDYDSLKTKFESDYDFLLMLGNSECGTCSTLKSAIADWISEKHYTVYYINELTGGSADNKAAVMAKLDNPTNWPRLYAVVNGEVEDVKFFGNSADATKTAVADFAEKNFEIEEFKAEVYRFESLAEYRKAVASGEQFIVYVGRDACPDCKNLSDIKKDNSLTKYFKEYEGKIYAIISEDTIAEHTDSTVWNDVTKWNGYWGTVYTTEDRNKNPITAESAAAAGKTLAQAQSSVTGNNKAENLAYMIAGGVFNKTTLELEQEAFLNAALEYANNAYLHDDGTNYMRDSIRSVPGLAAVNFDHKVEYATENDKVFQLIADNATLGTKTVGDKTYKTISTTKTIQVYDATQEKFVDQEVTYTRFMIKGSGVPEDGDNQVALWITHKNAFVGALGGKGAATFGTYTNNLTFSNIYTDCLTSRSAVYHTQYELEYVQAQTMNWMTSWVYKTAA